MPPGVTGHGIWQSLLQGKTTQNDPSLDPCVEPFTKIYWISNVDDRSVGLLFHIYALGGSLSLFCCHFIRRSKVRVVYGEQQRADDSR